MALHIVKVGDDYEIVDRKPEPTGYTYAPLRDTLVLRLTAADIAQFQEDLRPVAAPVPDQVDTPHV